MTEALFAIFVMMGIALVIVLAVGLVAVFGPACTALGWALKRWLEKHLQGLYR